MTSIHFASSLCEFTLRTLCEHFARGNQGSGFHFANSLCEFTFSLSPGKVCKLNGIHFASSLCEPAPQIPVRTPEDSHTGESFARSLPVGGDPYPAPPIDPFKTLQGARAYVARKPIATRSCEGAVR